MTTKMRSLRNFRNPIGCLILLAALGAAAGCSTAENPTGSATNMNHVLPSGSSVPGWLVVPSGGSHASTATQDYIANGGASGCTECHGSDLSGGISGTSCFGNPAGCHHDPVAELGPPPRSHGATAKKAPGSSGFASCQICHGSDFSGGGAGIACSHLPRRPRRTRRGRGAAPTFTHTRHEHVERAGLRAVPLPGVPEQPGEPSGHPRPGGDVAADASTARCATARRARSAPGGEHVGDDVPGGPAARERREGDAGRYHRVHLLPGLPRDRDELRGRLVGGLLLPVPRVTTAHSPHASQWRTGDTYVHTTTAEGNAAVCAFCHLRGELPDRPAEPARPGGDGARMLQQHAVPRGGGAPHPVGSTWVATSPAPQPHGNSAKAAPGSTTGYAYCKVCHGTGTTPPDNFGGGSSGVSCLTCHGNPHPPAPWRASAGSTYVHTSTDTGNAPICRECHFPGSAANPPNHPPSPAPAGTPPGCFNSTLCHNGGGGGAPHPVPYNDNAHFAVTAATFPANCGTCHAVTGTSPVSTAPLCPSCHVAASPLTAANCTSCHASPPNGGAPAGAVYANIAGAHTVHIALTSAGTPISCDTCHNGWGRTP